MEGGVQCFARKYPVRNTESSLTITVYTHFFIIAYRSALPMVWPSPSNWNEAAVSVAPGSCGE